MYIIYETMLDPMENSGSRAVYSEQVGYVLTEEEAKQIQENSRKYTSKDCWAIGVIEKEVPQFTYKEILPFNNQNKTNELESLTENKCPICGALLISKWAGVKCSKCDYCDCF